jgi:hypothetical protein
MIKKILFCFGIFILGIFIGTLLIESKPVQVITLTHTDTTLSYKIKELEDQNEILLDELQLKEGEISYWGQKYYNLKNNIND